MFVQTDLLFETNEADNVVLIDFEKLVLLTEKSCGGKSEN